MTRQEWQDFGYTMPTVGAQAPALMAGETYIKKQPARPASVESDVITPFWQAVITAVSVTVALLFLGLLIVSIRGEWPLQIRYVFGFLFLLTTIFLLAWLYLLGAHRSLLWFVETITGKDLDGDREKGKPEKEPFPVEWTDKENKKQERHYWPIPEEQVREIGKAHLHQGVSLSKRELAKHTSLSEEKALEVLKYMRQKAYAQYVDGNTTQLSGRGEYFFKQLLST
jgi:hypothetical protein